jgi:hypothetical protein
MLEVARTLAATGRFADPFMMAPTGLTATVPPAYPALLSLLARLFGPDEGLMWASIGVCLLAHGLYVMLLAELGERLFGSRPAGTAAALTAALLPAFPFVPQWDLALSTLLLLVALALPNPGVRQRAWFGHGALAGLLALCNPAPAGVALVRALWLAPRSRQAPRLLGTWALGAVLIAGPWVARNRIALGTWALRTNSGIALYTSYNDCARPSFIETFHLGCYNTYQVNTSRSEMAVLQRLGEVAYNDRSRALAFDWMRAHPRQSVALTAARIREFWLPSWGLSFPYAGAMCVTTLLGLAGWLMLVRAGQREAWFILLVLAILPLPYYFVVSDLRYCGQFAWAAQLCAGHLLARFSRAG